MLKHSMVYTDGIHLIADSLVELHAFAKKIGLKRTWFQDHHRHPHYDLTNPKMLEKALCEAKLIPIRDIIKQIRIQK